MKAPKTWFSCKANHKQSLYSTVRQRRENNDISLEGSKIYMNVEVIRQFAWFTAFWTFSSTFTKSSKLQDLVEYGA